MGCTEKTVVPRSTAPRSSSSVISEVMLNGAVVQLPAGMRSVPPPACSMARTPAWIAFHVAGQFSAPCFAPSSLMSSSTCPPAVGASPSEPCAAGDEPLWQCVQKRSKPVEQTARSLTMELEVAGAGWRRFTCAGERARGELLLLAAEELRDRGEELGAAGDEEGDRGVVRRAPVEEALHGALVCRTLKVVEEATAVLAADPQSNGLGHLKHGSGRCKHPEVRMLLTGSVDRRVRGEVPCSCSQPVCQARALLEVRAIEGTSKYRAQPAAIGSMPMSRMRPSPSAAAAASTSAGLTFGEEPG